MLKLYRCFDNGSTGDVSGLNGSNDNVLPTCDHDLVLRNIVRVE